MALLSNFLPRADATPQGGPGSAVASAVNCRPARPEEIGVVLRVVLASGGRLADEGQVADFIDFAVRRGIHLGDVWLAERGGYVLWAVLPIVSPGRTMLLLAPSVAAAPVKAAARARGDGQRGDPAGALIEVVCAHFASRGVDLAQALLDPADEPGQSLYAAHDFRRMAELIYLQAAVRRNTPAPALPPGFSWRAYGPAAHGDFAAIIVESYRGSLDCPALNGLRGVEDIIAGHKASGEFDPRLWLLLCENGAPLAVLLLARTRHADAMELVYLGLVPAARGRGLGELMIRQALHASAAGGLARLSLAVDAGNLPALKLYYRHGMQGVASKIAMMRHLRPTEPGRGDGAARPVDTLPARAPLPL